MKSLFLFILVGFLHSNFSMAKTVSKTSKKIQDKQVQSEGVAPMPVLKRPTLKPGQFTALNKGAYEVFETKIFNKVQLSANCFRKSNVPRCQAFEISKIKVKDVVSTRPGQTNPASMHCDRMSGESIIAFDHLNNEYDYCRFGDKSLVDSWTMFDVAFIGKTK